MVIFVCKLILFDDTHEQNNFPLSALGPTQPPMQKVLRSFSPGVKWLGRETDHSPPSIAEVKNDVAILPLPRASS
jgi:hypothetical protein